MNKFYLGLALSAIFSFVNAITFAQPGVLDQTFGNNGRVTIPVPLGAAVHPVDIKIQPDQKILVLTRIDTFKVNPWGYGYGESYFWMYKLLRFKPDGTPDSSFAVNGSTPVVYHERPANMELLANGQILLNTALQSLLNLPLPYLDKVDLCLTRYNSNGSIDNTFGINGRAITRIDTSLAIAISMFVLPNGKIIQAGATYFRSQIQTPGYNIMVSYDQNGNIDPTFGNNGIVKVNKATYLVSNYYSLTAAALTPSQTFLMLSNQKIVVTVDSGLHRFNSNGTIDATFGTNGYVNLPQRFLNYNNEWFPTFTGLVEPNNKMVFLSRFNRFLPRYPLEAFRFNYDGSLDTTFNSLIDEDFAGATSYGNQFCKVFLEPNGQYSLALGLYGGINNGFSYLAKINSNGSMDSTYGKRGKIDFPFTTNPKNSFRIMGNAAALQQDGKMVVGGVLDTATSPYAQNGWVIARFEKNARVKYNTLVANVFHDENANGIKDGNETAFNGYYGINTAKPGLSDTMRWYNQSYPYQPDLQDVDTGTYKSSVQLYNRPYFTVSPAVKTTSHSMYWNTDTLSFAVQQIANIRDLEVTAIQLNRAKPGFPVDYLLKVHNAGTDSAGNVVVKLVKSNKITYNSATVVPSSVVADTITWNVGGIRSLHDIFILVHGSVKAPPFSNLGDVLMSVATVSSDRPDTLTASDTSFIWQQVFGAYDPNDKTENHGGKISLSKVVTDEYLIYTIRFQNKGNDTAFNVYIRDTMDSKLDWNSLQVVANSHNYKLTMNDGKCVFTFPFIMLVDSIKNEPKSHGYIVYKIKTKPTIQLGDVIKNTAAIYFDYNLPIFTNTEITTVVADIFPLKLLSFTAKKDGKANLLQWTSVNEVYVDRFEVERSSNGREFSKLGTVKAGNFSYSFADNNPLKATNYYRLKMMDKDGKFEYSPVRMVNNSGSLNVTVYPNPANDNLQVLIDSDKKTNLQWKILSSDGKFVLSNSFIVNKGSNLRSINLKALLKGSYFLKMASATGDKEKQVVKFEKL